MITIRTLFTQTCLDQKKEYTIYHVSYRADSMGCPLPRDCGETYRLEEDYDFGHIIIETETKRYIFKTIPNAFEWVVALLDYINSHKDQEDIIINLDRLIPIPDSKEDFYEFDYVTYCVEKI